MSEGEGWTREAIRAEMLRRFERTYLEPLTDLVVAMAESEELAEAGPGEIVRHVLEPVDALRADLARQVDHGGACWDLWSSAERTAHTALVSQYAAQLALAALNASNTLAELWSAYAERERPT